MGLVTSRRRNHIKLVGVGCRENLEKIVLLAPYPCP